jgi:crossover junction endodeoxyribonuclease RuvC
MTKSNIYIGIDPGQKGAIAVIENDDIHHVVQWVDMKHVAMHIRVISRLASVKAFYAIEKVGARPGQGVTSMFTFGTNYGFYQGLLHGNGIHDYELVQPKVWQLGIPKADDDIKKSVYLEAKRLYPGVKYKGPRGGLLDGVSDAVMIAHWLKTKVESK